MGVCVRASVGKAFMPHCVMRQDSPRPIGQEIKLPIWLEDLGQALFAIDHVLGTGITLLGEQRREDSALGRHRIDRVFHHGELAGGDRAQCAVTAGGDADRVLNLFPRKV